MGGTRYNSRGLDDHGNVSNHCELEQIVIVTNSFDPAMQMMSIDSKIKKTAHLYSHVQVRGSMPFFWT